MFASSFEIFIFQLFLEGCVYIHSSVAFYFSDDHLLEVAVGNSYNSSLNEQFRLVWSTGSTFRGYSATNVYWTTNPIILTLCMKNGNFLSTLSGLESTTHFF